jgi:Cu-processing system ATP-binding protein
MIGGVGLNASVINVENVHKRFDEVHAVNGVTLRVPAGQIFGLIGHNGAGKSTLIKLMLGLIAPDSGQIAIMGKPVMGANFRETRRYIGYLPENVALYDNLSGVETLRFFAQLKGTDSSQIAPLLEKMHLSHAARRPVRTYSKGMRQRLGFAQALLGEPRVLFLDEPTSGLDPEGIREFYRLLVELTATGVTVLLSSHHLAQIQERVNGLALIRNGGLQASGSVQELRESLNMPVTIRIRSPHLSIVAIQALFNDMSECHVSGSDDLECNISCGARDKVTALGRIFAANIKLGDLQVQEPSLEDVFLGYTSNNNGDDNGHRV